MHMLHVAHVHVHVGLGLTWARGSVCLSVVGELLLDVNRCLGCASWLELLGAILQGKTKCVLQRATRDSSGARNFCLFLGPLRGQGAHMGAMLQNAFIPTR